MYVAPRPFPAQHVVDSLKLPFIEAGAVLAAIGSGLITTLGMNSTTGEWAGFQILAGFGVGLGFQLPFAAVSVALRSVASGPQSCGDTDTSPVRKIFLLEMPSQSSLASSAGKLPLQLLLPY